LAAAPLAGCGVVTGLTPTGTPSAAPRPSGTPPWILVAPGSATPSPGPSYGVRPSPFPTGFLRLPSAATGYPAPPSPTCGGHTRNTSVIDSLAVAPGSTSAVASWSDPGRDGVSQYRLTAVSQNPVSGRQRALGWATVTPAAPCGPLSATLTGLSPRTPYVFSLDAVVPRASGDGTTSTTVARSGVVYTK
jgi:Fibronectin type III domain